jgi:hypothetical protein
MGSTDALDMPGRRALGHIGRGNWRLFLSGELPLDKWREAEARRARYRVRNDRRYRNGWLRPGLT